LKIAINTRFLLKGKLEGMGWFTYEVVRRIVLDHPKHEFIFFFDRPFDPEFIFADNVTPVVLFPPARHPFLWYLWFEWSVARALKKYQPHVFLSTDNFLTLKTDVPTVLVTHDIAHHHFPNQVSFWPQKYYDYFVPKFNHKATRIVAVSEFTKKDVVDTYSIVSEKIAVACNGCRERFLPISTAAKIAVKEEYADGEDYFFYVGAIHPRKNVVRLIAAFDEFKKSTQSPMKLLLAGRMAWQTGAVSEILEKITYRTDVIFLGYLDDKELPKLTAAALASTYTSLFEGFGIPILEAMYCDTPVLTSTISSMPEVAGEAAVLVNPNSVEEIAGGMKLLFEDSTLRKELIKKGRVQRQKFSWERAAEVVYENLLLAITQ
jgi:glycosyltransferase involved in cell wall biosynthesis